MRKALLTLTIGCSLSIAYAAAPSLKFTNAAEARQHLTATTDVAKSITTRPAHKAPHKAPEGTWTSIGTGSYSDNLCNVFGQANATWAVEIEQSTTNHAWYRLAPFNENATSAIAAIGAADPTSYMYIDTTDPASVKFDDFACYGGEFVFTQGYFNTFGTFADNTITFPQNSIVMEAYGKAYYANSKGPVTIYLPGSDVKDYSMTISHDAYCTADNKHAVSFTTGADIAAVKLMIMDGIWVVSTNSGNASYVAAKGQAFAPTNGNLGITINASTYDPGIYSVMAVGVDAAGAAQAAKEVTFIVTDSAAEGWKELGTTTYNEMLYAGSYNDVKPVALEVTVMESTITPGRYLLSNPYANFKFGVNDAAIETHDHVHGIIINANNPAQVYVEASPLGFATANYGEGAVFSLAGAALSTGTKPETVASKGYFGTATKNDDGTTTIKMLANTVTIGEKGWDDGKFTASALPLEITIPADATNSISSVVAEQSTEAYDLQGRRLVCPAHGLYIQGGRLQFSR